MKTSPASSSYTNKTTKSSFSPELRHTKSFSVAGLGFSTNVRNTTAVLKTNKEVEEEIRLSEEQFDTNVTESENNNNNIVEEITEIQQLKTMKNHLHRDSHSKNPSISNLWSAASVLSKKWQKWRRKQKKNTQDSVSLPFEKPISRKYRETQSEIADYGLGRFSLDTGRISFDDPKYSFDEPRASWDGYLIGRTFPRLPPMVEDVPVVQISRSDLHIPVDDFVPGGSIQTREYYTDSSSKRRKSLDRSNSLRKMTAAAVVVESKTNPEPPVSNAKVSPATIDYNHNYLGLKCPSFRGERELARDSNSNSLRDYCSETLESGFRDNGGDKKQGKKPRGWRWKLWGFIHRGGNNHNDDDEDRFSRVDGVERSFSESWQQNGINKKMFRSNSSVSRRNSSNKSNVEINRFPNGNNRRVGGDEFVLERNQSARYSPNHTDSGLLRFYLTPLRGSRRSRSNAKNTLRL